MQDSSYNTTSKALKGVHSQTAIVGLKAIFSLIYFSIMSRLLSPDDFGFFALITAITTILSSLSEAGLGSAIIQRKDTNKDFESTAFTLSLIIGTIFSAILFFGAGIFSTLTTGTDILTLAYKIMSIMLFLQAITNITWAFYMRRLDFFKYGILQVGSDLLSYLTGILFALNGFGLYAIVAAVVSNQIFLTIILGLLGKYHFRLIIIPSYLKDILGYGGWLTAAVILRNLTNEIDKVIIGRILSVADLGVLNRPQGFINRISTQVNSVVDTVLFPILSSIQDDKDKIARGYLKIVSLVVTFSFFLGIAVTLGSKLVIDIFFGSQWEDIQPILAIFSFSMVMHGFSRVSDSFFRSLGIVKKYFVARLFNWIITIGFVILGCQYGILGAAIAMATGSLVSCLVKFLMQSHDIGVRFRVLIGTILRSVWMPLILGVFGAIIRFTVPYGYYLGLITFILGIGLTIWFIPYAYSTSFREIIIKRYLKR